MKQVRPDPSSTGFEAFRARARAWITAEHNTTPARWQERLRETGLICPTWPKSAGGAGLTSAEALIFAEECARAGAEPASRGAGECAVGPAILAHGTADQQDRLLPRIVSGADRYAVAFTEHGHGSDLTGITTRGRVTETGIVLDGRKSWVADAADATVLCVLCRTGPPTATTEGLTVALAPARQDTVRRIRPVRLADGSERAWEVVLEPGRGAPAEPLGPVGLGWNVAASVLAGDPDAAPAYPALEAEFWDLVREARKSGKADDPALRAELAWAYTQITLLRLAAHRRAAAPPADTRASAAVEALVHARYRGRFGDIATGVRGAAALSRPEGPDYPVDRWQQVLLAGPADSVHPTSSQLRRTLLAEQALGLPASPGQDRPA